VTEQAANAQKAKTDRLAGELLGVDGGRKKKLANDIAARLVGVTPIRLLVTGGAGSGKSSVSRLLAAKLDIPNFDFDKYIPGGYHKDPKVYRKRLLDGMQKLFDALPWRPGAGWLVEHVEACSADMLGAFQPTHCLHLAPPAARALDVAAARSAVAGEPPREQYAREQRAMESAEIARMQFSKVPGRVMAHGSGWELKEMR
jgi:hypothetical protein